MAATTSSNCSSFFSLRSSNPSSSLNQGSSGCGSGKLDGVATWLINGVTMVFFASLNRCSCIRIATEEDDDGEDANNLPLMLNDGNIRVNGNGNTSRRRTCKGKKSRKMLVGEE
ncbi:hypothetical protein Lal_00020431 [Lupinus albus]|uniref:Uncharacterized protein n=1 Tax=Lupinus albus TaxID=3870 RepID=A0A6A4Q7I4_LUPAL|nr:hypothetical protein Lalb_Chr08g0245211 [Lupinus albus]KAF1871637.1 hypothetical protein Lal_00020431 [Lupinus albus]